MKFVKDPNEIIRLLENEFGITTEKELDSAISKCKAIDISAFCCEVKKGGFQNV